MESTGDKARNPFAGLNDQKLIDYVLVIVGFGLCRAWIVFCLSASVASATFNVDWAFLLMGAGAASIAAWRAARAVPRNDKSRRHERMTAAMWGLIVASIVFIPASAWLDSPLLLVLGVLTGGAGAGLLQVVWGERFAAQNLYFSLLCAPAAAIVTGLVLSMTSSDASQLIFVSLPLASLLLLVLECKRCGVAWKTNEGEVEAASTTAGIESPQLSESAATANAGASANAAASDPAPIRLDKASLKLMFSIMVFSFLVRTFDAFPIVGNDPLQLLGGSGSFGLVIVGGIFLAISALLKDRMNVSLVYRLSLPIIIAGLVVIALFFGQRTFGSVLLVGIGYELFDILSWILFADIARTRVRSGTYAYGLGVAFTFVGMAAGYLVGEALTPLVENGTLQISALALVAILCLVVIAFLVLPESVIASIPRHGGKHEATAGNEDETAKTAETISAKSQVESGADAPVALFDLDRACAQVAKRFALTPRESEVLEFLARGRTLPIVARDLQITKNTARTHIEKIYQKTGIHKQQDLIDFIENWDEEGATEA